MINRDENKYMAEHSFISIIIHVEEDFFPMAVSKGDFLSFFCSTLYIPTNRKLAEVVGNWKSGKELDNV